MPKSNPFAFNIIHRVDFCPVDDGGCENVVHLLRTFADALERGEMTADGIMLILPRRSGEDFHFRLKYAGLNPLEASGILARAQYMLCAVP